MKEILQSWINIPLHSNIRIDSVNYLEYLRDPESILIPIIEWKWRKEFVNAYLNNPTEDTIQRLLEQKLWESQEISEQYSEVEKRVLRKIFTMFGLNSKLIK